MLTFELKNYYLSLAGTFAVYAALLFAGAAYIQAPSILFSVAI